MKQPSKITDAIRTLWFVEDIQTRLILAHLVTFYDVPMDAMKDLLKFYKGADEEFLAMIAEDASTPLTPGPSPAGEGSDLESKP